MQNSDYKVIIPRNLITILKFNDCQESIIDLEKRVASLINKQQRDKLLEAYNLLDEVQHWIIDNTMDMLENTNGDYILGTVYLREFNIPSDFPQRIME